MRLLCAIRRAQGLSVPTLAARLGTSPAVVSALEAGELSALPEWTETRRILDLWVSGAGLDPRPALANLALALEDRAEACKAFAEQSSDRSAPRPSSARLGAIAVNRPLRLTALASAMQRAMSLAGPALHVRLGMPRTRAARWAAIGLIAGAIGTTATQTKVVAGAISNLPAPAERAVRSISDFFSVRFAPVREGHRWIDVEEPRSRRGDKLRIGRHSD